LVELVKDVVPAAYLSYLQHALEDLCHIRGRLPRDDVSHFVRDNAGQFVLVLGESHQTP